jgi:hypothetical protein
MGRGHYHRAPEPDEKEGAKRETGAAGSLFSAGKGRREGKTLTLPAENAGNQGMGKAETLQSGWAKQERHGRRDAAPRGSMDAA